MHSEGKYWFYNDALELHWQHGCGLTEDDNFYLITQLNNIICVQKINKETAPKKTH